MRKLRDSLSTALNTSQLVMQAQCTASDLARITNWDVFKPVERESRSFLIDAFEETWYFGLYKLVNFYSWARNWQMLDHLK